MHTTVEGVYRNGKIELPEVPRDIAEGTPVRVTFLASSPIDLRTRGIREEQARDLRTRLGTIAQDWESPEMTVYDAGRAKLQTR